MSLVCARKKKLTVYIYIYIIISCFHILSFICWFHVNKQQIFVFILSTYAFVWNSIILFIWLIERSGCNNLEAPLNLICSENSIVITFNFYMPDISIFMILALIKKKRICIVHIARENVKTWVLNKTEIPTLVFF